MKSEQLWTRYRVRFDFLTSLCASVPANPELVRAWLEAREPAVRPPKGRSIDEIQEEVLGTLMTSEEEPISKSLLVFQRITGPIPEAPTVSANGYLALRTSTFRSHIKDCARQLSVYFIGKIKGEKSFSVRVTNCVYHDETKYLTPILDTYGIPFTQPTGRRDKAVHTWQGNALKTMEYIEGAHVEFTLQVLGGQIKEHDLNTIFEYGGVHGYGGERGDGEGRYEHTLTLIEEKTK